MTTKVVEKLTKENVYIIRDQTFAFHLASTSLGRSVLLCSSVVPSVTG